MHAELKHLMDCADGLLFPSESEHPFSAVELSTKDVISGLRTLLSIDGNAEVETVTMDYFFRNAVKIYPGMKPEEIENANRFMELKRCLGRQLKDVTVYRFGRTQIDAVILGQLSDGVFAGLRTRLIET